VSGVPSPDDDLRQAIRIAVLKLRGVAKHAKEDAMQQAGEARNARLTIAVVLDTVADVFDFALDRPATAKAVTRREPT
jgi:hypothetical protein